MALVILTAAVCGQWSIPLRHNLLPALPPLPSKFSTFKSLYGAKPKRTSSTATEVLWQSPCSPRLALLNRRQDAQLQCDVVVPAGTEVTWFKNHQPLLRLGEQQEVTIQIQQEAYEETTNEVGTPLVAAATSGNRLRISSLVFIDCADVDDEAEYSLELRTPTYNVYFRNFTVRLIDTEMGQAGSTCNFRASQLQERPRIYYYASVAWPRAGGSLTLPCRAQGRHLQHVWYVDNISVGNTNPNYQVLANGDLIIRTVGMHSPSSCRCEVSNTEVSVPRDSIITYIGDRIP